MTDYDIILVNPKEFIRLGITAETYNGPCINCRTPLSISCSYNPSDTNYYYTCPACKKTYNTTTYKELTGKKTSEFDQKYDVPKTGWTGDRGLLPF